MLNRKVVVFKLIQFFFLLPFIANSQEFLNLAVLNASDRERAAYSLLIQQFENTYPGSLIKIRSYTDEEYKKKLQGFISLGEMDVIYWQGGQRLYSLSKDLMPLNDIWHNENLDQIFSSKVKNAVTYEHAVLGLPYTMYHWGFYYNKYIYKKYSLAPPKTLEDFVDQCQILKSNGVKPLAIVNKDDWSLFAWFDYLSIRTQDVASHQKMLSGKGANTAKIREILILWKKILQACGSVKKELKINWKDAATIVEAEQAAAVLSGNYLQQYLADNSVRKIGFFRFPDVSNMEFNSEIAPIEVWSIPKTATNKKLARTFIHFVASPKIQSSFNQLLGYTPANSQSHIFGNKLTVQGGKLLRDSENYVQYFDRQVPKEVSDKVAIILNNFLFQQDIESATSEIVNALQW